MARRWFSRKELTLESETVNILTHTNDDFKLNGAKILTNQDLYVHATATAPATLDAGTISTITKNPVNIYFEKGGAQNTIKFFKVEGFTFTTNNTLSVTIGFGVPDFIIPVGFIPTNTTAEGLGLISNNGAMVSARWALTTTPTMALTITLVSGTFSGTSGTLYDFIGTYY